MKNLTLAALLGATGLVSGVVNESSTKINSSIYQTQNPSIEEIVFEKPLEIIGYLPCQTTSNCYENSELKIESSVVDGVNVETYTFKDPIVINGYTNLVSNNYQN